MLKKFVAIKNIGTFRNSAAIGNTELKKLTLVHAENGRGKTTLCAILRSLQSGNANLIVERKTLDSNDAPHVEVLFDSGLVAFKKGVWTTTCQHIEIFDAAFVAENVYSGDLITHDHKKNLCRVVLGADGVLLAKKFDDLDGQVRIVSNELSTAKDMVQKLTPNGVTLPQFIALVQDLDIDRKLAEKKSELSVLADTAIIQQKASLVSIDLPQPPANLTNILQKTIEGISSDAEQKVRAHIERHKMGARGETWLSEGLQFATVSDCPLCAQALDYSPIIDLLKTYFSQEYRNFQQELGQFAMSVDQLLSDAALLPVQKKLASNANLIEFWRKYSSETSPALSFDDRLAPVIRNLRNAVTPLVRKKLDSPLEAVAYSTDANQAIEEWKKLRDEVNTYNDQVVTFNAVIAAVKKSTAAKNVIAVHKELLTLETQKMRYEPNAVTAIKTYTDAKIKKTAIETAKDKAKDELDVYNVKVIGKYHDTVNKLLQRFGAKFSLASVKVEYTGRTPRTAFTFEIRGKEIDPGTDNTPPGTACFRNTLSAGDRNTLALAFFIAQLKNRADKTTLDVVFDDPFTSLDSFRQNWTCNSIRTLASEVKQVIVLSHSLAFLQMLSTGYDKTALKALQIDRHGVMDSHIIELDLNEAVASAVDKDVIKLRSYHMGDDMDARGAIRTIRPLLENHLRKVAPDQCPPGNGWLGTFLGDIQKASAQSPLGVFKPLYDYLDSLNRYTSPHAHDSGMEPAIDNTELQTHAELTLKLIGRI